MKVLVTDASKRASLAIIRSLGKRGVAVDAVGAERFCAGFLSKYCAEKFVLPDAQRDSGAFTDEIEELVSPGGYDVLIPVHDFSLIPILKNKRRLEKHVRIPFVDYATLAKTLDKAETLKLAKRINVPAPKTVEPRSLSEALSFAGELDYPVVIKPRSQTNAGSAGGSAGSNTGSRAGGEKFAAFTTAYVSAKNYCNDAAEFKARYKEINARSQLPLIQEYVTGRGVGVAALYNRGRPRALFSYKRLREYPVSGGPSTLRESTDDPLLKKCAAKLLTALKWHGLAMVEFKQREDGSVSLMEINGRVWGSIALPIAAGVDFPFMLCKLAVDGDVEEIKQYKVGVKQKWLIPGDLLHYWQRLREQPRKLRTAREFFKSLGEECEEDYLSSDDPLPALGAIKTSAEYFTSFLAGKRSLSGEYLG